MGRYGGDVMCVQRAVESGSKGSTSITWALGNRVGAGKQVCEVWGLDTFPSSSWCEVRGGGERKR